MHKIVSREIQYVVFQLWKFPSLTFMNIVIKQFALIG